MAAAVIGRGPADQQGFARRRHLDPADERCPVGQLQQIHPPRRPTEVDPSRRAETGTPVIRERDLDRRNAICSREPDQRCTVTLRVDRGPVHRASGNFPAVAADRHGLGPGAFDTAHDRDVPDLVHRAVTVGQDDRVVPRNRCARLAAGAGPLVQQQVWRKSGARRQGRCAQLHGVGRRVSCGEGVRGVVVAAIEPHDKDAVPTVGKQRNEAVLPGYALSVRNHRVPPRVATVRRQRDVDVIAVGRRTVHAQPLDRDRPVGQADSRRKISVTDEEIVTLCDRDRL